MKKSDIYRKTIINQILTEGQSSNNRVSFSYDSGKNSGFYCEIITLDEIRQSTNDFTEEISVEKVLKEVEICKNALDNLFKCYQPPVCLDHGLAIKPMKTAISSLQDLSTNE